MKKPSQMALTASVSSAGSVTGRPVACSRRCFPVRTSRSHATEGCCDANQKPRSHDTSRIAWAKLMARLGEEFPLECPACGGDIRLISFITEPGPIRKILTHVSPARGPPVDWAELMQSHGAGEFEQASPDDLPMIDIQHR